MTWEILALLGFVTGTGIGLGFAFGLAAWARARQLVQRFGPKPVEKREEKRGRTRTSTRGETSHSPTVRDRDN